MGNVNKNQSINQSSIDQSVSQSISINNDAAYNEDIADINVNTITTVAAITNAKLSQDCTKYSIHILFGPHSRQIVYSYSTECIKFTRNTNNTDLLYSQCILSVGCQCLMLHHICNECKYKIPTLNTSKVFIFCRIPKYTIWYSPNYHYPNKSLITFFHIYCCW